jgi:hypothetical protein
LRRPSAVLVVGAAILVAAARGRSSGALIETNEARVLITTDRAVEEARRRIQLGMKRPELLPIVDALAAMMAVIPSGELGALILAAETGLRDTVASRNGSTHDAHILALAWEADADVWTTDRDFAGAGIATWSTPNLMRSLAEAA